MKRFLYNSRYFIRETITLFRINRLSNLFSFISSSLIFFILALVLTAGIMGREMVDALENEAQISLFFDANYSDEQILQEVENLKELIGVDKVHFVDEEEAYDKMEIVLGEEAKILSYFDENPLSAYAEVDVNVNEYDMIIDKLYKINSIDYIRDNKVIIENLGKVISIMNLLGAIAILASGVATLIIVSHIIRQAIYQNKEQLNTMTLLGAPVLFQSIPFVVEGILMTFVSGMVATGILTVIIGQIHPQLVNLVSFIALPDKEGLISLIGMRMVILSLFLGIVGSWFGLKTYKY